MLALRVTYLGELGYELHLPAEYAAACLRAAVGGRPRSRPGRRRLPRHRLAAGWRSAISTGAATSRRTTRPTRPASASRVSLDKKSDFIGRAALEKAKAAGPRRKLITLLVDADVQLYGGEAIRRDGKVLGVTSSAGWGHTIGKAIAFGYVPAEEAGHADYEIEAFTRRHAASRIDGAAGRSAAEEDPVIGARTSRSASWS